MSRANKGSSKAKPPKAKDRKRSKANGRAAQAAIRKSKNAVDDAPPLAAIASLTLPDCLDADAAPSLKDTLLQRRGQPILVDASQVRRVGAQSLQILLAAARTWQTDNQPYRLINPSADFLETLALTGLSPEALLLEGLQS